MMLIPITVEDEMMRTQENVFKILVGFAERSLKKYGSSAHHTVGGLEDELHGAQLISGPLLAHVRSVGKVGGLEPHRERPYTDTQFFIQGYIEPHALKEIGRRVVEVIEHVVGQLGKPKFVSEANGLLVWPFQANVVKCNSQRL